MTIINSESWLKSKQPLIIATSGGGGHIIAAESLISQLEHQKSLVPYHYFAPPEPIKFSLSSIIQWACRVYHHARFNHWVKKLLPLSLPSPEELTQELNHLLQKKQQAPQKYIDFMLDIQPNGYVFTALFNYLQKNGDACSLHRITQQQYWLDKIYKQHVHQKIWQLLIHGLTTHKPYDALIITQPIGLAAIVQTINQYNKKRQELTKQFDINIPELFIHLFVTDIAYCSAQHYIKPLNHMTTISKQHLIIHTLDLGFDNQILEKKHATKVFRYIPQNFPIIRSSFKQSSNEKFLPVLNLKNSILPLSLDQKVASIMLSSSQGDATLRYLETLIDLEFHHIIIVGPVNYKLESEIQALQTVHSFKTKIYTPGFTDAETLSKIFKQSQLIVLKGGGLSLMELAAFPMKPDGLIFIHELHSSDGAGLIWEQGNINWFKNYCRYHHKKTLTGTHLTLKKSYLNFSKVP